MRRRRLCRKEALIPAVRRAEFADIQRERLLPPATRAAARGVDGNPMLAAKSLVLPAGM